MDCGRQTISRGADGRFLPGCSGNPAGKPPGTRHRATLLREVMREGDGHAMARHVVERAVGGDAVAARFCLDRIEPKPRGRPISLDLAEDGSAASVAAAFDSALRQLAEGEITPAEAVEISRFLESRMRALRASAQEQATAEDAAAAGSIRSNIPSPKRTHISSPPVRGEKDAQGWRGKAEPYPQLDEGLKSKGPQAGEETDLPPFHLHFACISRAPANRMGCDRPCSVPHPIAGSDLTPQGAHRRARARRLSRSSPSTSSRRKPEPMLQPTSCRRYGARPSPGGRRSSAYCWSRRFRHAKWKFKLVDRAAIRLALSDHKGRGKAPESRISA